MTFLRVAARHRPLPLLAILVAILAAGLGAWRWQPNPDPFYADRTVARRPSPIPTNIRSIPIETAPAAQPVPLANSTVRYALGDRLKITLFEKVDLTDEDEINMPATGLVERTELTGDYVVQENGYIVLPLIGAVEAEKQSPEQVVEALQGAFKQSITRPAKASVVLLEREPVYIVGKGIKPGSFKYSPGMTVLHAVALSGAGKDENSDVYAHTEYARGLENLEISNQRLIRLLAQAGALRAQQDGRPPEIPPRLFELAGAQEAKKLVDAAVAVRKLIVAAKQPQIAAYQASLAAARQEAASHGNRIALLNEHINLNVKRRDTIAVLRTHNDVPASALMQMENEIASLKEKKEEAVASLSKAQDSIAQAEQNLAKLEANMKLELLKEMTTTDKDIAEQEAILKATRRLTSDLRIAALRLASKGEPLSYEIVRRSRAGVSRIKATETTELMPGDLIQVISSGDDSGM